MKRNINSKGKRAVVLVLVLASVFGLSGYAFAGWGQGHGAGGHGGRGYGGGAGCGGYGMNMSDADAKAVKAKRDAFLEKTSDTRRELMKNRALMQAELAAETPDENRMKEIRKEISALNARMDEFKLAHMLEMRKAFPGFAGVCPFGTGRGMGHGMGRGMGHGTGCGMSR